MPMDFTRAQLISGADITKYSTLASLSFLIYDHVLTFDKEVEYIWTQKWSFGKALFLFNRYFGPFTLIFNVSVFFHPALTDELYVVLVDKCATKRIRALLIPQLHTIFVVGNDVVRLSCHIFSRLNSGNSAVTAVLSAEVILQARIYAVYDRNKKILATIVCLCILETATMLTIDGLGLPAGFAGTDGLTGCYDRHVPSFYFTVWIPEILFETILLCLMLYKAWRVYRDDSASSLLVLIVRDSILYFFSFFAVLMVNLLIWVAGPQQLAEVAVSWSVAVPCAMGSRLLLNMRERYFKEETMPWQDSSSRAAVELGFLPPTASANCVSVGTTTTTTLGL